MNCILSGICTVYNTEQCNVKCQHFIALHGHSGNGGRHYSLNIPTDYKSNTLENLVIKESNPDVYKKIQAYIKTFSRQFDVEESNKIKSIYLFSENPGTGKTSSAATILNEYLVRHYIGSLKRNRQPFQQPAYFLDCNEFQTLFNGFNRSNIPQEVAAESSNKYYYAMGRAKHAPFAVLDDIGVRSATEAFRGDLHSVINHRVSNRLPTVYTSNIPIEELAQVFDARLYDRIRDLCAVVEFGGESKRGLRR